MTFSVGASDYYAITGFKLAPDQQTAAISVIEMTGVDYQDVIRIVTVPDGERSPAWHPPSTQYWALIRSTAYSPSGDLLAVFSAGYDFEDAHVQVWRTSDWERLYTIRIEAERIEQGLASSLQDLLAWSPDGTLLAVGVSDGAIQILQRGQWRIAVHLIRSPHVGAGGGFLARRAHTGFLLAGWHDHAVGHAVAAFTYPPAPFPAGKGRY